MGSEKEVRMERMMEVINDVKVEHPEMSSLLDTLLELPKGDVVGTSDLNEVVMVLVHLLDILLEIVKDDVGESPSAGKTKDIKVKDELGVETKKEVKKEVKNDVDVESPKVKKGDGSVRCIKAFIQEAFMTGRVDENTLKKAIADYVRDSGYSMGQTKLLKLITEVKDQWKSRQSSWSDSLLELPKGDVVRTSDLNEVVMAVVHLRSN